MTTDVSQYLSLITAELNRQKELWGDQSGLPDVSHQVYLDLDAQKADLFKYLASSQPSPNWRNILLEEAYEATSETDPAKKIVELTQVAAVCLNWISAIEKRTK